MPKKKILKQHRAPDWYMGAKLGIFIHWGLYSVPAFAPTKYGDITKTVGERGFKFHFAHNPYAEWYQNSIRIFEDDYKEYHTENFGSSFEYKEFAPLFNESIQKWEPHSWARLFKKIGAQYVVLTTKHHDGFLLWPSRVKNPYISDYYASRDIVGELTSAVRDEGLKMGLYYSGALDWSFNRNPIRETTTMLANTLKTKEYGEYCDNQFSELIELFKPDILWNDIGYPPKGNKMKVAAHYLNSVPLGVINDRWTTIPKISNVLQHTFLIKKLINYFAEKAVASQGFEGNPPKGFADFSTPEYHPNIGLKDYKWEICRGIGRSFGFNRMETAEHYLSEKELIASFIDTISKNGNLLLNVGPNAEGKIPQLQKQRLLALGEWISRNKDGVFHTYPWKRAEGETFDGVPVRFTQKENYLFLFLLEVPEKANIVIKDLRVPSTTKIKYMGTDEEIGWENQSGDLRLVVPSIRPEFYCPGFKVNTQFS